MKIVFYSHFDYGATIYRRMSKTNFAPVARVAAATYWDDPQSRVVVTDTQLRIQTSYDGGDWKTQQTLGFPNALYIVDDHEERQADDWDRPTDYLPVRDLPSFTD